MKNKKTLLYKIVLFSILIATTISCSEKIETFEEPIPEETEGHAKGTNGYTKKLNFVLGDVKQAFIKNKISSKSQVDNLLKGFKEMKVNGIRIPIFAPGKTPNKAMYDYFHKQAKAQGFKIFANPALHNGGKRIANGELHSIGPSVLGKSAAKNALVKAIKDYSKAYKCNWICPFNEDGKPGQHWYNTQMNNIFKELKGKMNGAALIGPCTWGIGGGIDVLKKTDVEKHVSIVTTHNLGFEHDKWKEFKKLAGKKIWDSETNNNKKYANKKTRIQAAVDAGVNGLVLYDSWKYINMSNGNVNNNGKAVMDIYLK